MRKCRHCGHEVTGALQTMCPRCFSTLPGTAVEAPAAPSLKPPAAAGPARPAPLQIVTTSPESVISTPAPAKAAATERAEIADTSVTVGLVLRSFPANQAHRVNAALRARAGLTGHQAYQALSAVSVSGKGVPVAEGVDARTARGIARTLQSLGAETEILPMSEFMRRFPHGRASYIGEPSGQPTTQATGKQAVGCGVVFLILVAMFLVCSVLSAVRGC